MLCIMGILLRFSGTHDAESLSASEIKIKRNVKATTLLTKASLACLFIYQYFCIPEDLINLTNVACCQANHNMSSAFRCGLVSSVGFVGRPISTCRTYPAQISCLQGGQVPMKCNICLITGCGCNSWGLDGRYERAFTGNRRGILMF